MIEKAALHPIHVGRLMALRKSIYDIKCDFNAQVAPSAEPVPLCNIDKLTYFPIKKGQVWAECDNSERYDCAWFKLTANIPDIKEGDKVVALIDINGEGLVYRDGKILRGITQVLSGVDYFQSRKGKQVVELEGVKSGDNICLAVDAGFNGKRNCPGERVAFNYACVAILNTDKYDMYYDYLQAFCLALTYPDNSNLDKAGRDAILHALDKAYSAYTKGDFVAAREIIAEARDNKEADVKDDKINYTAIGHAHLDLAWLWPIRETKRKAARTLSTAIANIDKYKDYTFGVSQAQMLQWVKEDYPDLFERVRAAVKDGRIALQGGMWVENDCNIPCAESLIRQFIYGGKFFREEFGLDSEVVWLPDVFGYAANLPQIMLGCGKKYFMTIKLTWNTVNKFPYKSFVWKGIDGSEVLSHMAPQGDYNSTASPFAVVKSDKGYPQKDKIKHALLIYGIGDGGGGPG
ncbi:MAG: alpha-mannosidase, partial [Clostridia bacterium]|nr:alpha-mannosidase [Clostridia bacterium]